MATAMTGNLPAAEQSRADRLQVVRGVVALAATFAATSALWYFFLDPNGVMKLYTPMYGFSLVVALVVTVVTLAHFAEGWPLHSSRLPIPVRGTLRTAAAVALALIVVHGFFWSFLGRYGVTYFSPRAIVAAGGVGAEFFNARENASTAIVYLGTAFLWVGLLVSTGLGGWPWQATTVGVRAFSRLATIGLLAVLAYAVLFHPHVSQLFYPAQTMAGVPPWWADFARTASAYFNLGWVMASVAVLVVSDVLWDGWPWRIAGEAGPWRGLLALLGSLTVGAALFAASERGMNASWGEAFQGGQYTDAPSFRHLHVAELAGFLVLAAYVLDTFLPRARTAGGRAIVTAAAVTATAALHVFYYSTVATKLLGKVQGIAQPEDTPLVWTLLFLSVVLVVRDFFEGWPARARAES